MSGVKGKSGRRKKISEVSSVPRIDGFLRISGIDAEGREYFDRLFGICSSRKILQETDEISFNMFVVTFREWLASYRALKRAGKYEFDRRSGARRLSAEFKAERQLFRDVISLAREFGFTPSSRSSLTSMTGSGNESGTQSPALHGFISGDLGDPL